MDRTQEEVERITGALWPSEPLEEAGLALCEEAGEVGKAIIKRNHQRRGEGDRAPKDWTANLQTELAQTVIVALKMAEREGFSMAQAIEDEMEVLGQRLEALHG